MAALHGRSEARRHVVRRTRGRARAGLSDCVGLRDNTGRAEVLEDSGVHSLLRRSGSRSPHRRTRSRSPGWRSRTVVLALVAVSLSLRASHDRGRDGSAARSHLLEGNGDGRVSVVDLRVDGSGHEAQRDGTVDRLHFAGLLGVG